MEIIPLCFGTKNRDNSLTCQKCKIIARCILEHRKRQVENAIQRSYLKEKTRAELKQKLNELLGTDYNLERLNRFDLEMFIMAVQKLITKIYVQNSQAKKH